MSGPAVVTADGATVSGRDALTGTEAWSYTRDRELCTAAAGFPAADGRRGRVLALYEGDTGFCSELTALRPDTGARVAARNADVVPGTELVADDTFVLATGERYLEVERSDLVKTLEYGAVVAPAQPGRQPRVGCAYASTVLAARRLGVIERCPGEATDRLTVLSPDPADAEKPEEEFSVLLPVDGATVVALTTERVAVALPNPPRLQLLDKAGAEVGLVHAGRARGRPGHRPARAGCPRLTTAPGDRADRSTGGPGPGRSPWTRSSSPRAGRCRTRSGPALPYGGGLLVPVPDGLLDVDAGHRRRAAHHPGQPRRTGPARCGWPPPARSCWNSAAPRSSPCARPESARLNLGPSRYRARSRLASCSRRRALRPRSGDGVSRLTRAVRGLKSGQRPRRTGRCSPGGQRVAPSSRDTDRAAARSASAAASSSGQSPTGQTRPIAPTGAPSRSPTGAASSHSPSTPSSTSVANPPARTSASWARSRPGR